MHRTYKYEWKEWISEHLFNFLIVGVRKLMIDFNSSGKKIESMLEISFSFEQNVNSECGFHLKNSVHSKIKV